MTRRCALRCHPTSSKFNPFEIGVADLSLYGRETTLFMLMLPPAAPPVLRFGREVRI